MKNKAVSAPITKWGNCNVMIGPEHLRHFRNQSDAKLIPITTWLLAFSRALTQSLCFNIEFSLALWGSFHSFDWPLYVITLVLVYDTRSKSVKSKHESIVYTFLFRPCASGWTDWTMQMEKQTMGSAWFAIVFLTHGPNRAQTGLLGLLHPCTLQSHSHWPFDRGVHCSGTAKAISQQG